MRLLHSARWRRNMGISRMRLLCHSVEIVITGVRQIAIRVQKPGFPREAMRVDRLSTQGDWAANQMRATARLAVVRSRWSLNFVKKLTILDISSTEGNQGK